MQHDAQTKEGRRSAAVQDEMGSFSASWVRAASVQHPYKFRDTSRRNGAYHRRATVPVATTCDDTPAILPERRVWGEDEDAMLCNRCVSLLSPSESTYREDSAEVLYATQEKVKEADLGHIARR